MRYVIGSQLGYAALPFVFIIGVAYVWVADRLFGKKPAVQTKEEAPTLRKAA